MMSREVTHEAEGPEAIDTDDHDGAVHVCQCGLSNNKPFCDGSHAVTSDEDDDALYKYVDDDDENERREIDEILFTE
jgi:Uncharacterized conserved protein